MARTLWLARCIARGCWGVASSITAYLKRPPWATTKKVLKTGADAYAITPADVKAIAPIANDVWRWWMDLRPAEDLQCRADVFKGWHHESNKMGVSCLSIWDEDDGSKLVQGWRARSSFF